MGERYLAVAFAAGKKRKKRDTNSEELFGLSRREADQ